jgi:monofunctional chorismate mutase
MELSEIREKINLVDDQLLDLFLQRMDLAEEVAAYKNEHNQPILNKTREREILAKVMEKAGDREQYAYHLFSTLMELSRSRQAELICSPTRVAAQVKTALTNGGELFPQTGLVACQGVEGGNSQVACDRLFPRGHLVYVKTFQAVVSAVESGLCKFGVLPIENSSNGSVRAVGILGFNKRSHTLFAVRNIAFLDLAGLGDGFGTRNGGGSVFALYTEVLKYFEFLACCLIKFSAVRLFGFTFLGRRTVFGNVRRSGAFTYLRVASEKAGQKQSQNEKQR